MQNRRQLFVLTAALAAVAAGVAFTRRAPEPAAAAYEGEPALVAATFAAEWCSSCRILKPRLQRAMPDFAGRPVKFVEYDFTFGERDKDRADAAGDGLEAVYERYSSATGFTVLAEAGTGEVIGILTAGHSAEAMRVEIERALAVTEARAVSS